ncbi:hypothetical protein FB451DRAFT_1192944 [Mycena latifolia]|nr:hypothetical protein FB451DRAFT_1192944 [Mycena latifolia]
MLLSAGPRELDACKDDEAELVAHAACRGRWREADSGCVRESGHGHNMGGGGSSSTLHQTCIASGDFAKSHIRERRKWCTWKHEYKVDEGVVALGARLHTIPQYQSVQQKVPVRLGPTPRGFRRVSCAGSTRLRKANISWKEVWWRSERICMQFGHIPLRIGSAEGACSTRAHAVRDEDAIFVVGVLYNIKSSKVGRIGSAIYPETEVW